MRGEKVKTELNTLTNLSGLIHLLNHLESTKIGFFGGRRFKYDSPEFIGELSLNDIVQKFDSLRDQIPNDVDNALKIRDRIHQLDEEADEKLNSKETNAFSRWLTKVKSSFSSIFSPPKETQISMFSHAWSRDEILRNLGNAIPDSHSEAKTKYFIEEIFDEICHENNILRKEGKELKEAFLDFSNKKINETELIAKIINFYHLPAESTNPWKFHFSLAELIYASKQFDQLIELTPIIAAGYVISVRSSGASSANGEDIIENISIDLGGDSQWHLKSDPLLLEKAKEIYAEYMSVL
jgi:hypothetical protein